MIKFADGVKEVHFIYYPNGTKTCRVFVDKELYDFMHNQNDFIVTINSMKYSGKELAKLSLKKLGVDVMMKNILLSNKVKRVSLREYDGNR